MGASAGVLMGMQAAGIGMSAVGAYNQANAQKNTLDYEAAVARNNQILADYQADQALQVGAAQEQAQRLKTAQTKGDQRAALAANGVDLGEGSSTDILATTDLMGERDALTIRDNAARQAWALREQGKGYASEAAVTSASASAINPFASAVGTALTGATSVASSWYKYNRSQNAPVLSSTKD